MGETYKSHNRRLAEGWFDKYAPAHMSGIDLGCQKDPLNHTFRRWDVIFGDPDATFMEGVPDNQFQTVYASHLLEHLDDPVTAIKNWYRILRPTGYLIVCVPHRDLYEKKVSLPSNWNQEHKWFWLPETYEPPHTQSLKAIILQAAPTANIVSLKVLREGWIPLPPNKHSTGEYSIEAIILKP